MPRIFYGNFDFERELEGFGYNRPRQLERLNSEMCAHLLPLAVAGDILVSSADTMSAALVDASESGFPIVQSTGIAPQWSSDCELVPWGWSPHALSFANSRGLSFDAPPVEAVVKANSRQFSFEHEQLQGTAVAGAVQIDALEALKTAIHNAAAIWNSPEASFRWLLKSEFGMTGRERISGTGTRIDDSQGNWINRRLAAGSRLFFEPLVEPLCELSTQWCIRRTTPDCVADEIPELVGTTQLVADCSGQFLGSILIGESESLVGHSESGCTRGMFNQILSDAHSVVNAAQQLGYHGPVGVDSMIYRGPDGVPVVRPIQDVNARYTMGRIALEWFRRCTQVDRPAWFLMPVEWLVEKDSSTVLQTSPLVVAGQPAKRVGVLIDDPAVWQSLLAANLRP